MLFTILIGVIGAGIYAFKNLFLKIKFKIAGGNVSAVSKNHLTYAIFTDSKRYFNVFAPIMDVFESRKIPLTYLTASPDDPALKTPYTYVSTVFVGEGNKAFAKLNMLDADILLSSTPSLDVYQWKRSKNVKFYVHILHAANDATAYKMFGIDYFDALLLSGDYQIDQIRNLEALRHLPEKELKVVGLPHMDEMLKRYEQADPTLPHPTPTILLAPTWGANGILSKYGSRILDALLATGYRIIVRPHPQSYTSDKDMLTRLMDAYPESDNLSWNRDNDNFDVLRQTDLLISDFSGVIFDFTLIFDKPILYTKPDLDLSQLDACWLEDPLWTFSILDAIGMELNDDNLSDVKSLIDTCLTEPRFAEGRDRARRETWANIGHAAEDVVDYLVGKEAKLTCPSEASSTP